MNNKSPRVLMLGGLRYLIPVIKAAHELGCYVITCDYIPENIAHKYSDEYHNINIVDKEAVLSLAQKIKIDGIMSFAVDPGVAIAAYVCDKLGLPGNPYNSVKILQDKALFRNFLDQNGFNVPKHKGYKDIECALKDAIFFKWPVIVKPVDSAGSKGVTKLNEPSSLYDAIQHALDYSSSKEFIIEEFIDSKGYSSDSDCFSVNGKLEFISYSDQYFDKEAANPHTPSAYSWPPTMDKKHQDELNHEIQRLLTLLHMRTSIYNIETRIGVDNKAYIMEVSPRGGGNRLSEMLLYATGTDLLKNAVRAAIGQEITEITPPQYNGYWGEIILHSSKNGYFKEVKIVEDIRRNNLIELDLWVQKDDFINSFNGANNTIGTLVVKFESKKELSNHMKYIEKWLEVVVE